MGGQGGALVCVPPSPPPRASLAWSTSALRSWSTPGWVRALLLHVSPEPELLGPRIPQCKTGAQGQASAASWSKCPTLCGCGLSPQKLEAKALTVGGPPTDCSFGAPGGFQVWRRGGQGEHSDGNMCLGDGLLPALAPKALAWLRILPAQALPEGGRGRGWALTCPGGAPLPALEPQAELTNTKVLSDWI